MSKHINHNVKHNSNQGYRKRKLDQIKQVKNITYIVSQYTLNLRISVIFHSTWLRGKFVSHSWMLIEERKSPQTKNKAS